MEAKANQNATDFINEVEKFAKQPLHRKAEMIAIYETSISSNQLDIFRDLCFNAKYLIGMLRVLKEEGKNSQVKNLDHVKKDFTANMIKAIEQIRKIISHSDKSQKEYIEEEFFARTHSGLTNLNELLADLENAKLYLNYLKREKKN